MHAYACNAMQAPSRPSSSALTWMDEERPGSSGLHAQRTGSWDPRPGPVLSKGPQAGAAGQGSTMRTGRERKDQRKKTATCTSIIRPS